MSKYNARKISCDGYSFDSQAEYRRYVELKTLERAGEITGLTVHPEYELQPHFRYNGRTERAIKYTPDFEYMSSDGWKVVEDVKGGKATKTEAYSIRRRLFIRQHQEVKFMEVE